MPILQYHSVSAAGAYRAPSIAVSPALFERQMAFLAERYAVIPLDEVVRCLETQRPFPRRAVAITFDDGYLDNHLAACPILRRHGLTATFFVTAGPVARHERFWVSWLRSAILSARDVDGLVRQALISASLGREGRRDRREATIDHVTAHANRLGPMDRDALMVRVATAVDTEGWRESAGADMLRPEDVRAMVGAGMTIGSHTVSHPNLPSLSRQEALRELVDSRRLLEDITGQPVRHLAYPGGPDPTRPIFTPEIVALARQAGYSSASSSTHTAVSLKSDPFELGRYDVHDGHGLAGFAFRLEQHRFLTAPNRRGPADGRKAKE
jgi:peptidoglycan/xylan/chitin deacetylase (PgdA/CDA1 family)